MASLRKTGHLISRRKGDLAEAICPPAPAPKVASRETNRHRSGSMKSTKGPSSTWDDTLAPALVKSSGFAGLCVDCVDRETCLYARASGGIWHCEEYR